MVQLITVRNEVAKVKFLQLCVCPQGGGGGISACLAGGIPACLATGLQGGSAPWGVPAMGGLLLGGACSKGGCLLLGVCSRGVCSWGVWRPPLKQTATAADGTHPTGMHSSSS